MNSAKRFIPAIVTISVLAAACTSAPATTTPTSTSTTVQAHTTTTTEVTETTATTTPTTTEPLAETIATGDLPAELLDAVSVLMSWQRDDRNDQPPAPEALLAHLREYPIVVGDEIEVTGTLAELENGAVAVVATQGGDVLLGADEGDGWRIVGAAPEGDPAWYGEEPRMVLVIGSDARPGEKQQTHRADSIHILTANPSTGTATILGFPRDSYVSTPYGSMKFTSLMAGRGPQVMLDQVVSAWDLPVEGYVVTGFRGFENLMGEIGRLPIDLPRALPAQPWWPGFRAGEQKLSPQRTLEYSRTRKGVPGGDFTRSENQGRVMLAVLTLLQMNDIVDTPEVVATLLDHTWTDLTPTDLIQLGAAIHTLDPSAIDNVVLPGSLGRAGAASVVRLDPEASDMLADLADDGLLSE
ncbi:MAG: LCP family protein [Actinomycetota bacterium]